MNARATLVTALAGILSALMMLAPLSGFVVGFFLPLFAHAPLFVAGLTQGPAAAAYAGVAGAVLSGLMTGFNPNAAMIYLALYAAPVALITARALSRRDEPGPPSAAAIAGTGLAIICVAAIAFVAYLWPTMNDPATLNVVTRQARAFMGGMTQSALDEAQMAEAVRVTLMLMPGVLAGYVLLMLLSGFAIGQAFATRTGRALRPAPRMADLVIPAWAPGLFAIAVFGMLTETLAAALGMSAPAIAPVIGTALVGALLSAFAIAGMAIIHAWAESIGGSRAVLTAAYVGVFGIGLLILAGLPILAVALLGFLEPWLGLPARLRGPGRT